MNNYYIYGLQDPVTQQIRYVGSTPDPERRYKEHLRDVNKSRKSSWIKSLKLKGLDPEFFILEECNGGNWQELERFWIAYFKYIGANLTNMTEGGTGGKNFLGRHHSEETKHIISLRRKGKKQPNPYKGKKLEDIVGDERAKEIKRKNSQNGKGRVPWNKGKTYEELFGDEKAKEVKALSSASHRGKMVGNDNPFYGKKHTEKSKEKIRLTKKLNPKRPPMLGKKHSAETKIKISNTKRKVKFNSIQTG